MAYYEPKEEKEEETDCDSKVGDVEAEAMALVEMSEDEEAEWMNIMFEGAKELAVSAGALAVMALSAWWAQLCWW